MQASKAAVWLVGLLLVGCYVPIEARHGSHEAVPAFVEERVHQWIELKRQKSELAAESYRRQVFEIPGQGRVDVRWWALEGGPGWEYVRAKFTYTNTTDREFDSVRVVLIVRDHEDRRSSSASVRLVHPLGYTLKPGMMFVDEVSAPTRGLNRSAEGWYWTMDVVGRPVTPPPAKVAGGGH